MSILGLDQENIELSEEPGPKPKRKIFTYDFWLKTLRLGAYGMVILFVLSVFFPAPYSIRYLFNRIFFAPNFVCRDGVYSFAKTSKGACSGHGGIKRRIPASDDD